MYIISSRLLWIALVSSLAPACADDGVSLPGELAYDLVFADDASAWTPLILDFPEVQRDEIGLVSQLRTQAMQDGTSVRGLYQYGNNLSDDLFMAAWRTLDAPPEATRFHVALELASSYTSDCVIGGGANVYVKVGLLAAPPTTTLDGDGWVRAAFDKGQQSVPGATFPILGNLLNTLPGCPPSGAWGTFTLNTTMAIEQPPADGKLYLVVATESAFESPHDVLWKRVTLTAP